MSVTDVDREAFIRQGGVALESPAAVAAQSNFILTCLPSEVAHMGIMEGHDGLLQSFGPQHMLIEIGTYHKAFKQRMAQRIEQRGARVLEAEVSGTPFMVSQRKASLLLGGDSDLVQHCKPVLDAIADIQLSRPAYGPGTIISEPKKSPRQHQRTAQSATCIMSLLRDRRIA